MTESAASAGAIRATVDFDAAGLEAAVNKAMAKATGQIEQSIDRSMNDVQNTMRSGFKKVGAGLLGFLGISSIVDSLRQVGGFVLHIGQETEAALNNFRAVSGATAEEMKQVGDVASQLGNDISLPGTSAADAAQAMTELAKAGFSVDESMEAAKGTLQLATAAQIDAGAAAEISAKQLQAFGLGVEKAGFVADVLANAANATSADMQGMADSLNQVGAVAHASGFSFEETAGAVALMADNAIVGSDAGTSLKAMLIALQAPSGQAADLMDELGIKVYDQQGRMKSLAEITKELTEGTKNLTDQEKQNALAKIFGTDAIRTVNVLMNQGAGEVARMTDSLTKQGSAAKLAAANSRGLVGSLGALQSTAESVAIEIYQKAAPAVDRWLRGGLEALPGVLDDASTYLNELIHAMSPAAELVGHFISAAEPGAVIAFKAALAAVLGVVEALSVVLAPVAHLIEDNEGAFRSIVSAIVAATIAYKVMNAVVGKAQGLYTSPAWGKAQANVKGLSASMRSATTITAGFKSASTGLIAGLGGPWGIALAGAAIAVGIFASKQAEAKARVDELRASLDEQTGALTDNTRKTIANQLLAEGWNDDALSEYGVTLGEVTDAIINGGDALDRLREKVDKGFNVRFDTAAFGSSLDGGQQLADLMDRIADETAQAAEDQRSYADAQDESNGKMATGAAALKGLLDPTILAEQAHGDMSEATARAGTSFEKEADAADHARRAINQLNDEAISGIESQIAFEDASDSLRATIKDLSPAAIKSGKALDLNFKAGRDVYGAFIDLLHATEGVKGGMARAREQIFNTIRPMVDSKAQADRLTDQFFQLSGAARDVPNDVGIRVHADGVAATISALSSIIPVAGSVLSAVAAATHAANHMPRPKKGHAGGGPVYGIGTGVSDSLDRRLSNGEHVIRAKEVQAAGGQQGIFAIRAALNRGGLPAVAELAGGGHSLVENLAVSVGSKEDLPEALGEVNFHLRKIRGGSRYP